MSQHGSGHPGGAVRRSLATCAGIILTLAAATAAAQERQVYRCPGNLYTDTLSAKEAAAKGCKTLEGAPVTVVQSPRRPAGGGAAAPASASRGEARVDPGEQRSRDTESRRILEAELAKEEQALAQLLKDYNNGEPERRGDERNFQKYLDRVNEMKAAIERKQADIAAIKREIAKLGGGSAS